MPASRSRTEQWRKCLEQLCSRGSAIEISVNRTPRWMAAVGSFLAERGADLVWRVRILNVTDDEIIVEGPAAAGHEITLGPNVDLLGAMTIGQNRWMFHSRTLTAVKDEVHQGEVRRVLHIAMPDTVERCTRRHFHRISSAEVNLPQAACWPLLDPSTVIAAETANRTYVEDLIDAESVRNKAAIARLRENPPTLLPDVGPRFSATLINLSGGGLGLRVGKDDAHALDRRQFLWLQIDLRPDLPHPLAVTARQVHKHIESTQDVYVGLAFDFAFNPKHRQFVIDMISKTVQRVQDRVQGQRMRVAS